MCRAYAPTTLKRHHYWFVTMYFITPAILRVRSCRVQPSRESSMAWPTMELPRFFIVWPIRYHFRLFISTSTGIWYACKVGHLLLFQVRIPRWYEADMSCKELRSSEKQWRSLSMYYFHTVTRNLMLALRNCLYKLWTKQRRRFQHC